MPMFRNLYLKARIFVLFKITYLIIYGKVKKNTYKNQPFSNPSLYVFMINVTATNPFPGNVLNFPLTDHRL